MLTSCEGHSSGEFSIERPTPSDIALWCTALKSLTSITYTLPSPLGPFLQMPSTTTSWQISADHTRLYRLLPNGSADEYVPHGRPTRQQKFSRQGNIPTLSIPFTQSWQQCFQTIVITSYLSTRLCSDQSSLLHLSPQSLTFSDPGRTHVFGTISNVTAMGGGSGMPSLSYLSSW